MAQWTFIDPNTLLPGDPWTSAKAQAAFENLEAVAKGAAGAPRVVDGALDVTATNAGRNWVLARNALAQAGAVGTYVFARRSGNVGFGSTVSGSTLAATSAVAGIEGGALGTASFPTTNTPSGTWRCMGRFTTSINPETSRTLFGATLWLRIA